MTGTISDRAHTIDLPGCTPEPLLSYLKALGLFRLAYQVDSEVRASWKGDQFQVQCAMSRDDLVDYLLDAYCPSPVLAPWNGGSGFWDTNAAGQALAAVAGSTTPRLSAYRAAITGAQGVIIRHGLREAPKGEAKDQFLRSLRNELPDQALDWLDAAVVLTETGARYAALLGTGGNDGRLDFAANFLQRLASILPFDGEWSPEGKRSKKTGAPQRSLSRAWLLHALLAEGRPALVDAATGQFHPGGVGGANATQGFEGNSLVNPWEFVLMLEGSLLLAGSAARRYGSEGWAKAAFPFSVDATAAGWGTLSGADAGNARAELWLPLWQSAATFLEVCHLFGEGRAQVGSRQARSGLEFARAIAGLGVDRGIIAFSRYGFLLRNGLAYLASPLGRIQVREQPSVRLLDELDSWLITLRGAAEGGPNTLQGAVRQLDRHLFAAATDASPSRLQAVLIALGEVEEAVSHSPKLQDRLRPLDNLSTRWLEAADDETPEWRLAVSLASIGADRKAVSRPIRLHWEPLRLVKGKFAWASPSDREVFLTELAPVMLATLERRLLAGEAGKGCPQPHAAVIAASPGDIETFLQGGTDDQRILALAVTLATLKWDERDARIPSFAGRSAVPPTLPRAYALLKLLFQDDHRRLLLAGAKEPDADRRPSPANRRILALMRSGRSDDAFAVATHRIRAIGRSPLGYNVEGMPRFVVRKDELTRLTAALLFPITDSAFEQLASLVLQAPSVYS